MKEIYIRPQFHIEYFSLSQSIAAGCGAAHWDELTGGPNHWDKTTCGWTDAWGDSYWINEAACANKGGGETHIVDENFPMEGVCYNNPDGAHSIFSSY